MIDLFPNQGVFHPDAISFPLFRQLMDISVNKWWCKIASHNLMLDDYHMIWEKAVHDTIVELLIHFPEAIHLVVVSRRNPSFPIFDLRARGKMTEI
ncbi:MAG: hypothetical protein V2I56_20545 [Desulfobacteraceae bacterium]|jgi:LuxR family maltose regulon positive regulatory protein|nr:hypothetical protein [Desulfobacteraceae bacterium]